MLQLKWFSADAGVKQEAVRAGRGSTVDYSGWGLNASLFGFTVTGVISCSAAVFWINKKKERKKQTASAAVRHLYEESMWILL